MVICIVGMVVGRGITGFVTLSHNVVACYTIYETPDRVNTIDWYQLPFGTWA
jgi:hypothetical protein